MSISFDGVTQIRSGSMPISATNTVGQRLLDKFRNPQNPDHKSYTDRFITSRSGSILVVKERPLASVIAIKASRVFGNLTSVLSRLRSARRV